MSDSRWIAVFIASGLFINIFIISVWGYPGEPFSRDSTILYLVTGLALAEIRRLWREL